MVGGLRRIQGGPGGPYLICIIIIFAGEPLLCSATSFAELSTRTAFFFGVNYAYSEIEL